MIDLNKRPNILLVEDDAFDFELIQSAMGRTPGEINLFRVEDGDMAVDYLNGTPPYDDRHTYPVPTTMVLDIKLPKRSGLEVLQWLRTQAGPIKRLPTLILTSSKHQVDINQAFERGANAYLTKPDSIKELIALLGEFKSFWLRHVEVPELSR